MLSRLRPRPQWIRLVQAQHHARRFQSLLPTESESFDGVQTQAKRQTTGSIFVRVEDGIVSIQEAFAIVRGLEKRLGRIRDFQLVRGRDDPTMYRPFFFAELEEDTDWQELPLEPVTLSIKVPKAVPDVLKGITLADLRDHLLPQDKQHTDMMAQSSSDAAAAKKVQDTVTVEVKVEKSDKVLFYSTLPEFHRMGRNATLSTGERFVAWGGFYDPSRTDLEPAAMPTYGRMERAVATWNVALKTEAEKMQKQRAARTEEAAYADAIAAAEQPESHVDAQETRNETQRDVPVAEPAAEPLFDGPSVPVLPLSLFSQLQTSPSLDTPAEPETVAPPPTPMRPSQPLKPTRKERILAQARENARRAPVARTKIPEEDGTAAETEKQDWPSDQADAGKTTLQSRLWRLMGTKW